MKKRTYILLPVLLLSILYSCKKETLKTYDTADNIYFHFTSAQDSLDVTFAYSEASVQDSVVNIPVYVTGVPINHDRTFTVEIDPSSTAIENTHYVLPETFTIHAGQVIDNIPIRLIRTQDIKDEEVILILQLKTGGDFKSDLEGERDRQTFKISFSDILVPGPYWSNSVFGTFSVKKVQLLREVAGMPFDFLISPPTEYNYFLATEYYGIILNRYLLDMEAAGNTVYEEDGVTPMKMGNYFR